MPDYKKKKHSRFLNQPAKASKKRMQKKQKTDDIIMSPKEKHSNTDENLKEMKVIKGNKYYKEVRSKVGLIVFAVVLIAAICLQMILPGGIFDSITNSLALLGTGNYPIELGNTTIVDSVSKGSYYYVLSSESITAYSNTGKKIFTFVHGFEFPILKTSDSRAMVFAQGGNDAYIFNLSGLKESIKTENAIITANISDSGYFAIATHSKKYTAEVKVYSKNAKVVYDWFSAEDTVNNVALSKSGRKLAVSTFNSSNGIFKSKLSVLNYKSATPVYKKEFSDTLIYSIDTTHPSYFAVVLNSSVEFIKWSNQKTKQYTNEYSSAFFRGGRGGYIAVFNRESNKTDNKIAVFSKSGVLKSETVFKGIISDIQVRDAHIYCISDTDIYLLSKEGGILRKASCGFGALKLNAISTNAVTVVSDNSIEKINLEREMEE